MTNNLSKSITLILFVLFAGYTAFPALAQQVEADDITGVWLNEEGDARIAIENRDGKYFGTIVWLRQPMDDETGKPKLDKENSDPELQKRPILGLELLKNFEFNGDDEWEDGEIYDPKSGKTYSCYMEFPDNDNKDKLKVRGYVGVSLLGRTTYWTRVNKD